jgi:glycine cleavage system H protein
MEIGGCIFPDDRLYDREGLVWVKFSFEYNYFTLGITQLNAYLIGKITSLVIKKKGTELSAGKNLAYVETPKYFGSIIVPISSIVQDVNEEVLFNPSLLNSNPYERGWVAKLIPTNLEAGRSKLTNSNYACECAKKIIEERGIRCFSIYPDFKISGIGGECPETLRNIGDLLEHANPGSSVLLVTDNPKADQDVSNWVSIKGYAILEKRIEPSLKYYIIGKK